MPRERGCQLAASLAKAGLRLRSSLSSSLSGHATIYLSRSLPPLSRSLSLALPRSLVQQFALYRPTRCSSFFRASFASLLSLSLSLSPPRAFIPYKTVSVAILASPSDSTPVRSLWFLAGRYTPCQPRLRDDGNFHAHVFRRPHPPDLHAPPIPCRTRFLTSVEIPAAKEEPEAAGGRRPFGFRVCPSCFELLGGIYVCLNIFFGQSIS